MLDRAAPVTTIVEAAVCGVPGPPLYQHRLWLLLLGLCNLKALLCVGEASANEAAELL
jgi:hypothetical protein